MPDQIPTASVEGPAGETLFHQFRAWAIPPEWATNTLAEMDSTFAHLSSDDDRAVALVGALLIEDAVNSLVSAYAPGYKRLSDNHDFTLSMRIELARALRLCPARLLGAADAIRLLRNDFAHRISVTSFDACEQKHRTAIRGHLEQISPQLLAGKTERTIFVDLVGMVTLAIRGYSFHVERLNKYVRTNAHFMDALAAHCRETYPQWSPDERV